MKRLLCCCLLLLAAAGPVNLAATPIPRLGLPWWRERFEAKQQELARKPQLIFLGDSITQDWERSGPPPWADFRPVWQRFYGDRQAVNLGFTGDTTANLLWRIEHGEAEDISPRVAVVLIGANNFGRLHWSAAQTVDGIGAIVAALHRRLPQTRILLISVLPSGRSAWATESTAAANAALAARYGQGGDVAWVDVTRVFAPGGRLDASLYFDPRETPPKPPLHPTAQGQERLAAAIEPTLARLLGDRSKLAP